MPNSQIKLKNTNLKEKNLRIFIGLRELAGNNQALCKGLNAIGAKASFINWYGQSTYVGQGEQGFWVELAQKMATKRDFCRKLICSFSRRMIFVWALFKFDIFFFSTDQSFSSHFWDLPILKLFGKRIIFQFHGTDSRLPWMNCAIRAVEALSNHPYLKEGKIDSTDPEVLKKLDHLEAITLKKAQRIATIEKYADVIIDCPEHGHLLKKPFIHRIHLGRPTSPYQSDSNGVLERDHPISETKAIKILHCPSRRKGKGSQHIRRGIQELQGKGVAIEYTELFRVSNEEVVKAMANSDLIIDQVLDDIGYSGISTEAALMGKPALIAGYNYAAWVERQEQGLLPPFIVAHAENWTQQLEQLCNNPQQLKAIGALAQQYVQTHWQLGSVAERYLKVMMGQAPSYWYTEPKEITYINGWGLLESELKAILKAYYAYLGKIATNLKLKNTPYCKTQLLKWLETP